MGDGDTVWRKWATYRILGPTNLLILQNLWPASCRPTMFALDLSTA